MQDEAASKLILDHARAANTEADVYIASGKQTNISVRQGEVDKLSFAGSKGIGIRVIKDGQMGYAYTSDFSPASLEQATVSALALAEAVDPDPRRFIPEPQALSDEDLAIYDAGVASTPMEDKVALAIAVEAAALAADPRVKMPMQTVYVDGVSHVTLTNSKGFAGSYDASFAASYTMVMAIEGQDRATGFGLQVGRSPQALDAGAIGREAGERAARLLGGRPVATQEATVVYSPLAAASILAALSRALTAEAMQRNRSFLAGKMGQDVAADVVTVLDNGRLPGGLASRPFDDEGQPTAATRLIDEGVLQAVLYDSFTAAQDGTNSTGNASRGSHREPPRLAPSNFYLQPGRRTADEVIAEVEQGLYVVNVMNTASINPVSGDYSVSAQGFWIENGQLTFPVNNVTVALPLDRLLQNVRTVGNDLLFLPFMGAIGTPTFRVDGVMIGGRNA